MSTEQPPAGGGVEAPAVLASSAAVEREKLASVAPEGMATITFLITLNIQPGADPAKIREILPRLAAGVAAKPGAQFYQSYQKRPDLIEFIETFQDSAAALYHLQHQDMDLVAQWYSQIALESIAIVGPASDTLRAELAKYPMTNAPQYMDGLSGFPPQPTT